MRPSNDTEALIYFVLDATRLDQRVKIGYTTNLSSRLLALSDQTVTRTKPIVLALERGTLTRERELHLQFKDYRIHGEWFDYGAIPVREYIAALPNPIGWMMDNRELWPFAGNALGLPRVPSFSVEVIDGEGVAPEADSFRYPPVEF